MSLPKLKRIGTTKDGWPLWAWNKIIRLNIGNNHTFDMLMKALYDAGLLEQLREMTDDDIIELMYAHNYSSMTGLMKEVFTVTDAWDYYRAFEKRREQIERQPNPPFQTFTYHVDLNERGQFDAHIENAKGEIVFEIHEPQDDEVLKDGTVIHSSSIFEDGFMKHIDDMYGLEDYLRSLKIIKSNDRIRRVGGLS